jgi:hypothetical protein
MPKFEERVPVVPYWYAIVESLRGVSCPKIPLTYHQSLEDKC